MEQSVMQNATQTIKINFSRKMYDFFNAKCGKSYVMQNETLFYKAKWNNAKCDNSILNHLKKPRIREKLGLKVCLIPMKRYMLNHCVKRYQRVTSILAVIFRKLENGEEDILLTVLTQHSSKRLLVAVYLTSPSFLREFVYMVHGATFVSARVHRGLLSWLCISVFT